MNNKIVIGAVSALVIIVGIVVLLSSTNNTGTNTKNIDTSRPEPEPTVTEEPRVPEQAANEINYKGFAVSPKLLTVKKGATVTWINQDDAEHDVTPEEETDDFKASELFSKGETYKVTFNTVGTYNYHCSPHPYMKGTIEVVE